MNRALAVLGAALTAAALLLTACGNDDDRTGRVVAKIRSWDCETTGTGKKARTVCGWEHELTTRDGDGADHEFEVSASVYGNCRRGSAYPGCIDR